MRYLVVFIVLVGLISGCMEEVVFPQIVRVSYAGDYQVHKVGDFDVVTGDDGYSGQGCWIGDIYVYNDNQ